MQHGMRSIRRARKRKRAERAVSRMAEWIRLAACRAVDGEVFFPVHESKPGQCPTGGEREAVAICGTCPVRVSCLGWALEVGEVEFGVLGGLTASERTTLLQRQLHAEPYVSEAAA